MFNTKYITNFFLLLVKEQFYKSKMSKDGIRKIEAQRGKLFLLLILNILLLAFTIGQEKMCLPLVISTLLIINTYLLFWTCIRKVEIKSLLKRNVLLSLIPTIFTNTVLILVPGVC